MLPSSFTSCMVFLAWGVMRFLLPTWWQKQLHSKTWIFFSTNKARLTHCFTGCIKGLEQTLNSFKKKLFLEGESCAVTVQRNLCDLVNYLKRKTVLANSRSLWSSSWLPFSTWLFWTLLISFLTSLSEI